MMGSINGLTSVQEGVATRINDYVGNVDRIHCIPLYVNCDFNWMK